MSPESGDRGEASTPAAAVQTYSGGRLHERPRRFSWQGVWLEVAAVLKEWRTPTSLGFLVADAGGRRFCLRYSWPEDAWQVEPRAAPGEGPDGKIAEKI